MFDVAILMKIVLHELLVKDHNTVVFNLHGYTSNKELKEIVMFPDTSQFHIHHSETVDQL